jgi:hypothetical protein
LEFDLENVRHIRRLARRVVKQLTMLEAWLKKAKKRHATASPDEIAAAFDAIEPFRRRRRKTWAWPRLPPTPPASHTAAPRTSADARTYGPAPAGT